MPAACARFPASRRAGRSGNCYPSGKRKRKSGIRLPLPPSGLGEGRGRPAGAEPRGAVARGGVGPARILLPVDSPLGSLALASREMKVGFCGIWGPREPLALGSRPRQTNIGLMCLHRWIGGGPFMLSIWTRCLPLRRVTFVRMPFGWVEAPRPRPAESHQQSWRCAPPDLDPSTLWIPTGTFPRPPAAWGMMPTCLSPACPCLSSSVSRENGGCEH